MVHTSLNKIFLCNPSKELWDRLLARLGKFLPDDEPLNFHTIVCNIGLHSALWCCQSLPEFDKHWRLYAVWCARQLRHNQKHYSKAMRGYELFVEVIEVAERYANGGATPEDLHEAWFKCGCGRSAASATAEQNAALAAQKAAQFAVKDAAHLAGIQARLSVPETSDGFVNDCNWTDAYDRAYWLTNSLILEKQKQEFFRILETLDKIIRHHDR